MSLESRIAALESRNIRVENNKAWEISLTRRASVAVITYITASLVMMTVLKIPDWYLGALIPTGGYLLSTLSLPYIRKIWEKQATTPSPKKSELN